MRDEELNSLKPSLIKTLRGTLQDWQLYLLLLPAVAYLFIFAYIPMEGVIIAFKDYRTNLGINGSEWVGLKHFIRFVNFPNFWLIMRNTATIGLYSFATFPCSVILALMINEITNLKFKKTVQLITYAPYFLSTVVVCSMLLLFFNTNTGMINNLREMFGLARVDYLTNASYFAGLYVWSGVWQGVGWGTIIYLAALSNVSQELVEAARIDGANRLKVIWHVNIPSIMPTIVIMLILSCGGILGVGFEKIFLLQNSLNLSRSQVISTYVYQIGLLGAQYSYASAIGLFNTTINVILIVLVNMVAKKASEVSIW
jgi:putative aldouronate transport system permease protein